MADKTYTASAPMVFVRLADERVATVFGGQPIPRGVEADELKRLEDEGFITPAPAEGGLVGGEAAVPTPGTSARKA